MRVPKKKTEDYEIHNFQFLFSIHMNQQRMFFLKKNINNLIDVFPSAKLPKDFGASSWRGCNFGHESHQHQSGERGRIVESEPELFRRFFFLEKWGRWIKMIDINDGISTLMFGTPNFEDETKKNKCCVRHQFLDISRSVVLLGIV